MCDIIPMPDIIQTRKITKTAAFLSKRESGCGFMCFLIKNVLFNIVPHSICAFVGFLVKIAHNNKAVDCICVGILRV